MQVNELFAALTQTVLIRLYLGGHTFVSSNSSDFESFLVVVESAFVISEKVHVLKEPVNKTENISHLRKKE